MHACMRCVAHLRRRCLVSDALPSAVRVLHARECSLAVLWQLCAAGAMRQVLMARAAPGCGDG
jgi:hypothetical protein